MLFKINKHNIKVPFMKGSTWNEEEIKFIVENNGKNKFISTYVNIKDGKHIKYVIYTCLNCNSRNDKILANFIRGAGCKTCSNKIEGFKRRGEQRIMSDFSTLENCQNFVEIYLPGKLVIEKKIIENRTTKFLGYWIDCKHEFKIKASNIKNKNTKHCNICKTTQPKQLMIIKDEILERNILCENLIFEFKNSVSQISCKCLLCDYEWLTTYTVLVHQKCGCPFCVKKGESFLLNYLNSLGLVVKTQFKIDNCIFNKRICRFDFYVEKYNLIIELCGSQHYEFVKHFHKTVEEFERRKLVDQYKKNFATSCGFNYLEIKNEHSLYWKHKEESIKMQFLNYIKKLEENNVYSF